METTNRRMSRRRFLTGMAGIAASGALLAACGGRQLAPTPIQAASTAPAARDAAPRLLTGMIGRADYRIQAPAAWNGTLLLYSHGMVFPDQPNPAMEVSDPATAQALLAQGYALAGTSYSTRGWAIEQAMAEQLALLDLFARQVSTPERTIAWGDSLGGMVSAGLVQCHPERFAGALPMCGPQMGGVALWNGFLDSQYAFKTLLAPDDPALQIVRIADPNATFQRALDTFTAAQQSPAGRARLALATALYPTSDAHTASAPAPVPTDPAARAQYLVGWFRYSVMGLPFVIRPDVEARAGGNPSFNTGISYRELFARSPGRERVVSMYRQAGLDLDTDLQTLEDGPRVAADLGAVDYLRRFIVYDGALAVPVLTLHTIGDPLVAVAGEQAYAETIATAGGASLLRQVYVDRAGHTTYTPAERLAALAQLVRRIDTGRWDDAALAPAALTATATALGPSLNVQAPGNTWAAPADGAAPPAFAAFQPPPYTRPFDARTPNPDAASPGAAS